MDIIDGFTFMLPSDMIPASEGPICHLAIEILLEILLTVIHSQVEIWISPRAIHEFSHSTVEDNLVRLRLVCSSWNAAILQYSRMWTVIGADISLARVYTILDRSRLEALCVVGVPPPTHALGIMLETGRVRELHIAGAPFEPSLTKEPYPSLTRMSWGCVPFPYEPAQRVQNNFMYADAANNSTTALTRPFFPRGIRYLVLDVHLVGMTMDCVPNGLVSLDIGPNTGIGFVWGHPSTFRTVLCFIARQCPQLQILRVPYMAPRIAKPKSVARAVFGSLVSLSIYERVSLYPPGSLYRQTEALRNPINELACLDCPVLRTIHLVSSRDINELDDWLRAADSLLAAPQKLHAVETLLLSSTRGSPDPSVCFRGFSRSFTPATGTPEVPRKDDSSLLFDISLGLLVSGTALPESIADDLSIIRTSMVNLVALYIQGDYDDFGHWDAILSGTPRLESIIIVPIRLSRALIEDESDTSQLPKGILSYVLAALHPRHETLPAPSLRCLAFPVRDADIIIANALGIALRDCFSARRVFGEASAPPELYISSPAEDEEFERFVQAVRGRLGEYQTAIHIGEWLEYDPQTDYIV